MCFFSSLSVFFFFYFLTLKLWFMCEFIRCQSVTLCNFGFILSHIQDHIHPSSQTLTEQSLALFYRALHTHIGSCWISYGWLSSTWSWFCSWEAKSYKSLCSSVFLCECVYSACFSSLSYLSSLSSCPLHLHPHLLSRATVYTQPVCDSNTKPFCVYHQELHAQLKVPSRTMTRIKVWGVNMPYI